MAPRLKSLELHGYKTFANRTLFEFSDSITAIVGPNGSGKSNIADSLRWVLGEQSYSLLRGKKTEDMIFSGSEFRSRAGMASATVTFDNTDGWLPIDFSEVAITRRAYRDGENEYLINGQRMRLRDVHELLGNSGLGERTYTIIGQGLVDAALSLKAEERRRLFEEAAGIGLHRGRREEALRRLDTTRRNLDRVRDILAELQPRLNSLERQARRAQEYNQLKADLRIVLHDWYGYHWHRTQQELAEARKVARLQDLNLESTRQEQNILDEKLKTIRVRIQGTRQELNFWHHDLSALHTRREQSNLELAVTAEKLHSLDAQQKNLELEQVRLEEEVGLLDERRGTYAAEHKRLKAEYEEALAQRDASKAELATILATRAALERELHRLNQEISAANGSITQLQARIRESDAQHQRDTQQLATIIDEISRRELEFTELDQEFQSQQAAMEKAEANMLKAEQEHAEFRVVLSKIEAQLVQGTEEKSAATAALAKLKAELGVLQHAEASLAGYTGGTRLLLQAGREKSLKGVRNTLVKDIIVKGEHEVAIGAILGDAMEAVILEDDVDQALDLLLEKAARGMLLPLNSISSPEEIDHPALTNNPLVIGRAIDQIRAPEELVASLRVLIGDAYLVKDRAAARELVSYLQGQAAQGSRLRIATLDGQVFHLGGPILVSGIKSEESTQTLLGRQRRQRELSASVEDTSQQLGGIAMMLEALEEQQKEAAHTLEALAGNLQNCRSLYRQATLSTDKTRLAYEQAKSQLDWHITRRENLREEISRRERDLLSLKHKQDSSGSELERFLAQSKEQSNQLAQVRSEDAQQKVTHWDTSVLLSQRMLEEAQRRYQEADQTYQRLVRQQNDTLVRIESTEATRRNLIEKNRQSQVEYHSVGEQIELLQEKITPAEISLDALERDQEQVQSAEAAARQSLNLAEHHSAQARIAQTRSLEALQNLRNRIEEDFGLVAFEYDDQVSGANPLPLEGMVDRLPLIEQLSPDVEESLHRLQSQLRRIGPINPEAQEEYEEVQRRFGFMTDQINDLEKAEGDVRQVIKELDTLMEQEFTQTFSAVADEFKAIFTRLFGGGSARLILSDPDDLTTTGIEIEARLPGRRTQGLVLLSGGERSLTATALIFALLKVSPTPFCLLDEVDAMLDEANVGRFRDLLRELSQRTQFIIVTHNRNTVQAADVIYGVTMGRDSSSQVLSLKMDEVADIVE
jgi:chromosome segregation protein